MKKVAAFVPVAIRRVEVEPIDALGSRNLVQIHVSCISENHDIRSNCTYNDVAQYNYRMTGRRRNYRSSSPPVVDQRSNVASSEIG